MPDTVTLRTDIAPEHILVVVMISSHHLTGLVGVMHPEFGTKTVASKRLDVEWYKLEEREQRSALAEIVRKVCDSAGVSPKGIFLSRSETSITSRTVVGDVMFNGQHVVTQYEMDWALQRAEQKQVGTDQELIDLIPVRWECTGIQPVSVSLPGAGNRTTLSLSRKRPAPGGPHPLGVQCSALSCTAVQIIAHAGYRAELTALAESIGLGCDGVIGQTAALYRGIAGRLSSTGWSLVIDCGARHTSILLRSGDRLLRVRTYEFGGDHITRRLTTQLQIGEELAEQLKREVDISATSESTRTEGQQTIWGAVMAHSHELLPEAASVSKAAIVEFFGRRAQELREDPDNPLPSRGHIHLVGRASRLGGLTTVLGELFGLEVILGTESRDPRGARDVGEELDNLLLSGLIVSAIDQRRMAEHRLGQTLGNRASRTWGWLRRRFE